MKVEGVDPRDVSQEDEHPTYRVYFWHQPEGAGGWNSDERRITEALDVGEVLAWAETECGADRVYAVYAEYRDGPHLGLMRLAGVTDPNEGDWDLASIITVESSDEGDDHEDVRDEDRGPRRTT